MKKQRWRKTKPITFCSGCGCPIFMCDKYGRRYGFCSVSCGYTTYGLSWSDFI